MRRVAILAILLCLFAPLAGFAADPGGDDIRVKAEIDKAFLTIGERLTYTVLVEHAPDIQVLTTIVAPAPDILEVKKSESISKKNKKNIVEGKKFILTTYRLGEFIIDPVTIQYRKAGQDIKSIQANKLYVTVQSVAGDKPQEDIRDVKGVVPLRFRLPQWFWVLLVLGLAGGAVWAYRRFFRGKEAGLPEPSPLTAEEEAMLHLTELFESDFLKRGLYKRYYLRLSEILRVYFEKRYQVLAAELTTTEILRALRPLKIHAELYQKVQAVLDAADLAKFAKWVPTASEVLQINKKAEEIIRESAPRPPVTPEVTDGV